MRDASLALLLAVLASACGDSSPSDTTGDASIQAQVDLGASPDLAIAGRAKAWQGAILVSQENALGQNSDERTPEVALNAAGAGMLTWHHRDGMDVATTLLPVARPFSFSSGLSTDYNFAGLHLGYDGNVQADFTQGYYRIATAVDAQGRAGVAYERCQFVLPSACDEIGVRFDTYEPSKGWAFHFTNDWLYREASTQTVRFPAPAGESPLVTMLSGGEALAVYQSKVSNVVNLWGTHFDALPMSGWLAPDKLGTNSDAFPNQTDLTTDGADDVFLAYDVSPIPSATSAGTAGVWVLHWKRGMGIVDNVQVDPWQSTTHVPVRPVIAHDGMGGVVVAYVVIDQNASKTDLYVARWTQATGFAAPMLVEQSSARVAEVTVRIAAAGGHVVIAWGEGDPADPTAYAVHAGPDGKYSTPTMLGVHLVSGDLAAAPDGSAVLVAGQVQGTDLKPVALNLGAGGAWTAPTALGTFTQSGYSPRVAMDAQGRALAVWEQLDDQGHFHIWGNRFE